MTRDDFTDSDPERRSEFPIPDNFDFLIQTRMRSRRGRKIRPRSTILIEILEACRTPAIEHWIMIKARLGYETFWNHMNRLLEEGKMICSQISQNHGGKSVTYYSLTPDGLQMLEKLRENKTSGSEDV